MHLKYTVTEFNYIRRVPKARVFNSLYHTHTISVIQYTNAIPSCDNFYQFETPCYSLAEIVNLSEHMTATSYIVMVTYCKARVELFTLPNSGV